MSIAVLQITSGLVSPVLARKALVPPRVDLVTSAKFSAGVVTLVGSGHRSWWVQDVFRVIGAFTLAPKNTTYVVGILHELSLTASSRAAEVQSAFIILIRLITA